MEEGKGKELEHTDSSDVEQQATATAASTSTEWGNIVRYVCYSLVTGILEAIAALIRARTETAMLGEVQSGIPGQSWPLSLIVQKHSVNELATDPVFFQPYWNRLAIHWNLLFAVAEYLE